MKVESRGKYPGVKLHLEPEEVEIVLFPGDPGTSEDISQLLIKMRKKITSLKEEIPTLLQPRTPEEVEAILIKESEKASLQLAQVRAGKDHAKVDKAVLKKKLLSYVED